MWHTGTVTVNGTEYRYEAKVYDNPSQYGISNGRISKLWIEGWVASYDRGWDVGSAAHPVVQAILALYR